MIDATYGLIEAAWAPVRCCGAETRLDALSGWPRVEALREAVQMSRTIVEGFCPRLVGVEWTLAGVCSSAVFERSRGSLFLRLLG